MKRTRYSILLAFAMALANTLTPISAQAIVKKCTIYDFKRIFIADFATGSKWDNSSGDLQITWSANSSTIYDETVADAFTELEISWIRTAFRSWDNALETVSFREVAPAERPQIVIGFVDLKPSEVQLDAMGFWNTWVSNGNRYRATIKLKVDNTKWFSNKSHFIHTVQHELGNTLGLGDLAPSKSVVSVLEDPWQPPYGKSALSTTDVAMIRQLYGETSCATISTTKL
jgi:Matrixin